MTDIVVVSLLSNSHLCAELGEEKSSMINVNLKKYPRQIQHPVTDLKMKFLTKIVYDFKLYTIFTKKYTIFASEIKYLLRTTKELYYGFLE